MGKRVLCLICVAAVLMIAFFGIRAGAQTWREPPAASARLSKAASAIRSSTPLASAMLLVLGGLGIALLFDRRDRH